MKLTTVCTTQLVTALALAALLSSEAEASKKFVKMIPNGGNVPDTPAIGHPDGTGDDPSTNAFGDAFAEAGNKWTKELCEADSDGDGQTNGQELGDPCCEWDKDTNPTVQWTTGVSHPSDASKTSNPSLWANLCGASEATTESSSMTDDSTSMEPAEANGFGSTTSEPIGNSALGSAEESDESHSHSSDMHDSSSRSSNNTSFATGSMSTSGSSSSAVDVGSPSTSSESSRNAIRGSNGEDSAASSAHTPSTSSSSSSGPASSGASGVKPFLAAVAGIVATAMAIVA